MNVNVFGSVEADGTVGTGVSVPLGSGGGVRPSVTGRTSIVGSGPVDTRTGVVVVGAGRVDGADAVVVGEVGRGAVDGGSGTNTRVVNGAEVLGVVLVGAGVVGAVAGAVVGATVVRVVGEIVVGVVVAAIVVGTMLVGTMLVGTTLVDGAIGAIGATDATDEGGPGGTSGTKGSVPVGRPGVVEALGCPFDGDVVGDAPGAGAPAGFVGAGTVSPSGGTMSGANGGGAVLVVGAIAVVGSEGVWVRGFFPGRFVVVGMGALVEVVGVVVTVGTTTGAGTSNPSAGTTAGLSPSRNSGSGRASGTVTLDAKPWRSGTRPEKIAAGGSRTRAGPATAGLELGRVGPAVRVTPPAAELRRANVSGGAGAIGGGGRARQ